MIPYAIVVSSRLRLWASLTSWSFSSDFLLTSSSFDVGIFCTSLSHFWFKLYYILTTIVILPCGFTVSLRITWVQCFCALCISPLGSVFCNAETPLCYHLLRPVPTANNQSPRQAWNTSFVNLYLLRLLYFGLYSENGTPTLDCSSLLWIKCRWGTTYFGNFPR